MKEGEESANKCREVVYVEGSRHAVIVKLRRGAVAKLDWTGGAGRVLVKGRVALAKGVSPWCFLGIYCIAVQGGRGPS